LGENQSIHVTGRSHYENRSRKAIESDSRLSGLQLPYGRGDILSEICFSAWPRQAYEFRAGLLPSKAQEKGDEHRD